MHLFFIELAIGVGNYIDFQLFIFLAKLKVIYELNYFRMFFPWFIAKKFIFSKKDSRFINFISAISVVGIALGVATLVIALSVLNGFEQTITNKIVDFDSHIKITSYRNILPDHSKIIPELEEYLKDFSPDIIPFASKLVIVSSKKRKEGLNLIGIEAGGETPGLIRNITKGRFILLGWR